MGRMVWDVAAGVIIGGAVLGLPVLGLALEGQAKREGNDNFGHGYLMAAVGLGLGIWVLFFKAHFQ